MVAIVNLTAIGCIIVVGGSCFCVGTPGNEHRVQTATWAAPTQIQDAKVGDAPTQGEATGDAPPKSTAPANTRPATNDNHTLLIDYTIGVILCLVIAWIVWLLTTGPKPQSTPSVGKARPIRKDPNPPANQAPPNP